MARNRTLAFDSDTVQAVSQDISNDILAGITALENRVSGGNQSTKSAVEYSV
jgi:hypothetical protein